MGRGRVRRVGDVKSNVVYFSGLVVTFEFGEEEFNIVVYCGRNSCVVVVRLSVGTFVDVFKRA